MTLTAPDGALISTSSVMRSLHRRGGPQSAQEHAGIAAQALNLAVDDVPVAPEGGVNGPGRHVRGCRPAPRP